MISTVVVTIIVSVSFFIKLNKNFHLTQYFKSNATLVEIPFMPIISEGSRIIIEQVSSYLFFLITIHFCNRSDFTNIGIISTITGLFLVPSIASMRGTALSLSSQIQSIKNKLILNCIISIIIIFIFISCSETIIVKLYGISNYDSTLFKLFRISLPFLIFIKSIDAVIRGKIQFHLKQKMLFKIDTAVTWGLYLPLSFLLFSILKCYFFPVILLFQALTELIIIVFATKTSMYTQ